MLRTFQFSSLLLAGVVLFPPIASAASVSAKDDVIEIRGTLEPGDANRFEQALSERTRLVRVRSPGGQLPEAMRIGKVLQSRKLDLEVVGLCASACAQLLLPGAKGVRIEDGSIVAMHAAAEGAFLAAEREGRFKELPGSVLEVAVQPIKALRLDMDSYLAVAGVSREAMDFMYRLTSTSEVTVTYSESKVGKVDIQLAGRRDPLCRVWLLNSESLSALGIRAAAWRAAGRLKASMVLGESYDEIYDGPARSAREISNATACAALRNSAPTNQGTQ